jgi:mRNA interferase RelE/StbE
MRTLKIERRVMKDLESFPFKHQKQIKQKICSLKENSLPHDSKVMKGMNVKLYRVDQGEYRIVYALDEDSILILFVGKRNDGEVFRKVNRKISQV